MPPGRRQVRHLRGLGTPQGSSGAILPAVLLVVAKSPSWHSRRGEQPFLEWNVIMLEVTMVMPPPVVVLLHQRNYVRRVSLGKRHQGGFGSSRPEGHVHGAVGLDGGGQLGTGLFPPAAPNNPLTSR
jgi:hypothetical protein